METTSTNTIEKDLKMEEGFAVDNLSLTTEAGPTFWIVTLSASLFCYFFLLPLLLVLHSAYTKSKREKEDVEFQRETKNLQSQKSRLSKSLRGPIETISLSTNTASLQGQEDSNFQVDMSLKETRASVDPDQETFTASIGAFFRNVPTHARLRQTRLSSCMENMRPAIMKELLKAESKDDKALLLSKDQTDEKYDLDLEAFSEPCHVSQIRSFYLDARRIVAWDHETQQLTRLMSQFAILPALNGILELLMIALIGLWVGTNDLAAYLLVNRFVGFSVNLLNGAFMSGLRICSTHPEVSASTLGQYAQITMILLLALTIPLWTIWAINAEPFLKMLGMNQDTIRMGTSYAYLLLLRSLVQIFTDCFHYLLARAKKGNYNAIALVVEQATVITITSAWITFGMADLVVIGLIQLQVAVALFATTVGTAAYKGWLQPYRTSLMGRCAISDGAKVWNLCKAALTVTIGNIVVNSEWEILALLASVLGSVELITWCLIGSLWDSAINWLDGISLAASIRIDVLSASEAQNQAIVLSAQKSLCLYSVLSLLAAIIICITGDNLLSAFTDDTAIQQYSDPLYPLLGLSIPVSALGVMSWNLLVSQSRDRLKFLVRWSISWCMTIPSAALLTDYFHVDIWGQMTSLILGAVLMGTLNFYHYFSFGRDAITCEDFSTTRKTSDNDSAVLRFESAEQDITLLSTGRSSKSTSLMEVQSSSSSDFSQFFQSHVSSSVSSSASSSMMLSNSRVQSESTAASSTSSIPVLQRTTPTRRVMREFPELGEYSVRNRSNTTSSSDGMSSTCSSVSKMILEYRDQDDLGCLSDEELELMQDELNKVLIALSATIKYDLDKSKKRVLEELQWVLYVSPDIFEFHHLEKIIVLLHQDGVCRRELWPPIQTYLPEPLVRMGLERLLRNDYLKSAHLKTLMDKYVLDQQFEGSTLAGDESLFVEQGLCGEASTYGWNALCFVLQE